MRPIKKDIWKVDVTSSLTVGPSSGGSPSAPISPVIDSTSKWRSRILIGCIFRPFHRFTLRSRHVRRLRTLQFLFYSDLQRSMHFWIKTCIRLRSSEIAGEAVRLCSFNRFFKMQLTAKVRKCTGCRILHVSTWLLHQWNLSE